MSGFPEVAPDASGLHAAWYAANREAGAVTAQRCDSGHWRHPARYRCAVCGSDQWSFEPVSADATVQSWTVTRRVFHPGFADVVPYAILVVRSPEGPQFLVHLRPGLGDDDEPPAIGAIVTLGADAYGVPHAERS